MAEESTSGGITPIGAGTTFLTVAEVAATLRVSKMSVYRLIHTGQLEAVRFGRSFRVTGKALDVYLKESFFQTG